jgi:hypothetical protein
VIRIRALKIRSLSVIKTRGHINMSLTDEKWKHVLSKTGGISLIHTHGSNTVCLNCFQID